MRLDVDEQAEIARTMKAQMDWADLMPQLVSLVDGELHIGILAVDSADLPRTIAALVAEQQPTQILLIIDAYSMTATTPPDAGYRRGSLGERFAAGDPAVTEALMVTSYDGLTMECRHLPYDAKRRVWLEVSESGQPKEIAGRLADALEAGWWLGMQEAHR